MRCLIASAVLLAAPPARAMGSDRTYAIVAWNDDGSSVLLNFTTDRDGDRSSSYIVVSADDKPVAAAVSDTRWHTDSDAHHQEIDKAACTRAVTALQKAVAAHRFRGVTIRLDRCALDTRDDVVAIGADATKDVAATWVAYPMTRKPSAREKTSWDLVAQAIPGGAFRVPLPPGEAGVDVANKTGKLIVVLEYTGGGNPYRMNVHAFRPDKAGFASVADL